MAELRKGEPGSVRLWQSGPLSVAFLSMLRFNPLAVAYLPLVHAKRKPTVGINANPSFEKHGRTFLAVVGKRDQDSIVALLALWELHLHLLTTGGNNPPRQLRRVVTLSDGIAEINKIICRSAPAANRTRTTGSGDLCDILFTTGADVV